MFKQKKIYSLLLILVLLFSSIPAFATEAEGLPPGIDEFDIRILHNGKYIKSDTKPKLLDDGTLLAPLRFILESSDYKVDWNKNGLVTISKGDEKLVFNSNKPDYKMEKLKGTISVDLEFFKQFKDLSALYDNVSKTIILKSSSLKDDEVFYYDLGERTMRTVLDHDLTYKLNGGITVPKKDNNPLVIVLHGAHYFTKSEFNRYDLGYSYLLRDLKENGYAAMALNVGINYSYEDGEPMDSERLDHIFEETIRELIKANKGEKNNFDIDLENKLDLDNVILLGHSRSGDEIFKLTSKYKKDDRFKIKGLLSIAPARNYVIDYSKIDIPTGIVLPSLDGDVFDLDGHWIFDELIDDKTRKSETQVVTLYGANHNGFNQNILKQDEGDTWFKGEKYKISPEEQREFLKIYSKNFISTVLNDKSLYENIKAKDESLYAYKALLNSFVPGTRVYSAEDKLKDVTSNKAEVKDLIYSNYATGGTTNGFYPPGSRNSFKLLNIKWNEKNSSVSFNIKDKAVKDKERLVLYIAEDSTDKLNKKSNQQFKVTLVDNAGKESSFLTKKDDYTLRYHDGHVIDDLYYSTHTPLGFLDIPLAEFKNIDKNNLKEIRFDLTEKDTGSLMLRHIQFN